MHANNMNQQVASVEIYGKKQQKQKTEENNNNNNNKTLFAVNKEPYILCLYRC